MEFSTIITIVGPILMMGIIMFFVLRYKKHEPLGYAEFFMKDKNSRFLHVFGAKRIMPEDGESYDVFEHYVFDTNELKFIKGESQRGKNLNLKSEFVKRSMNLISQKLNTPLEFVLRDPDFDDEKDGLLKVYRFEDIQSDTELNPELSDDNLSFIKHSSSNIERFTMIVCRHGRELKRYDMKGNSDYFFKTIYLEERLLLCFLYNKQRNIALSGMALCMMNYETGEILFDGFVRI